LAEVFSTSTTCYCGCPFAQIKPCKHPNRPTSTFRSPPICIFIPEVSGGSLQILTTYESIIINDLQHNNEWIALAYCSIVTWCALLRHAFTTQITSTCAQSKQVKWSTRPKSNCSFSKQLAWLL